MTRSGSWQALMLASLLGVGGMRASHAVARPLPQSEVDVPPDAAPEIQQVKPNQAAPGDELTLVIDGKNFSAGAYVSFSNPTVHVISTRRVSATQLETRLAVGKKAQPGTLSLFVSNPASSVAEAPFTVTAPSPVAPPTPAPAPTTTTTKTTPPTTTTVEPADPEVTQVAPARASRGSVVTVKITGKNFAPTARVVCSNPGVRITEVHVAKAGELTAAFQVAPDARTGETSLFVVNPDDREAEARFQVTDGNPPNHPTTGGPGTPAAGEQCFEVYNLGEGISILQNPAKSKGTLVLAGGKLKYEDAGKEVFSVQPGEIKEIDANTYFGVSTGTFHIILNAGKTYNFIASSLRAADTQAIVEALRRSLR